MGKTTQDKMMKKMMTMMKKMMTMMKMTMVTEWVDVVDSSTSFKNLVGDQLASRSIPDLVRG